MRTAQNHEEIKAVIRPWKRQGLSVGFAPTMGFLHEGHESLMRAARKDADKVVVSIFVNPLQFGPSEDFERYPRDFEHDLEVCRRNGVDLIFFPQASAMYPADFHTHVEVGGLTEGLCGASRPGHFTGVCTVVCKLFHIIEPDFAYFGQKDAQQLAVIRQMAQDLNMPVKIVGCPIVREKDGLAKSSRNAYLDPEERSAALSLSRALRLAEAAVEQGQKDSGVLRDIIRAELAKHPLVKEEYVEIVDAASLRRLSRVSGSVLIALAAKVGNTRLIDNVQLRG